MPSIIIKFDPSIDTQTLNRIRRDIVTSLKQRGLAILASYTDDTRLYDNISKVDPIDMTTPVVSGATSATPDVSGA